MDPKEVVEAAETIANQPMPTFWPAVKNWAIVFGIAWAAIRSGKILIGGGKRVVAKVAPPKRPVQIASVEEAESSDES